MTAVRPAPRLSARHDPLVIALRLVLAMIAEQRAAERVAARAKLRLAAVAGARGALGLIDTDV